MVRLLIAFIIFPSVWSFSLENSSSSSFNSPQALRLLQHRIENLEEPGRFMNNRTEISREVQKEYYQTGAKIIFFL